MAERLDEIDHKLLAELQRDADRTNLDLARAIGLSPGATLNRVRRLKESGVIRSITATVDPDKAGFPLHVYVTVEAGRHGERADERLKQAVEGLPQVVHADWVTGQTDAVLEVVARSIEELQRVLLLLSSRGGALRVTTLLRLEELKPRCGLPVLED